MPTYRPQFSMPSPVIFGNGAIAALGENIRELGCKKVLIICDKGVEAAGITKKVTDILAAEGLAYVIYNGVLSDPPDTTVDEAGALAVSEGADCLIGLGGGSSMDTAKATAIYMHDPAGPVKRYILQSPIMVDTKTPIILIPTTSGTGSECTKVAVISRPDMNAKWSAFVNTTLAIVDPELTLALPKRETANTGLDALTHAVEALTGREWNYHSDLFAEGSITKIWNNLYTCYADPSNAEARLEMSLAANWAGMAFNNPITHVGHSVADALSCEFHTPHGLGCALAIAETVALISTTVPDRTRRVAAAMGLSLDGTETDAEVGKIIADAIRALMRSMDMPSLTALGYDRERVVGLAQAVVDNHLSSFCPVDITLEVAKTLLENVYDSYT